MINTAKRLEAFPEYIFSELAKKKKEVEQKTGRKVLDLSIGSPNFRTSDIYLDQLICGIKEETSHLYPGYGAIPEFSDALMAWYKKRFSVELHTNELLPLLGAKDGISHLPLALLDPADEVLIPDPGYPGFTGPTLMIGAKPVYYNLSEKNNYKIDISEIKTQVNSKTKYMWINYPSNPTGQVITLDELKPLVTLAKEKNILLVYDNAYSEITFDEFIAPSILQIKDAKDIAVEIGSFSKTYSFAGLRMGWIVGNTTVIAALAKVKSQLDSGLWSPLQKLGAYALAHENNNWKQAMLTDYQKRQNILIEKLHEIDIHAKKSPGSLYLWANIPQNAKDSMEFCLWTLEEKQVLLAPGSAFGENGEGYVRVSISSDIATIDKYL